MAGVPKVALGPTIYTFGVFRLDLRGRQLQRKGEQVKIQDQPFQILELLILRPGEVVTREELRQKLWPGDTYVEFDDGLNTAVKKLRLALQDSAENPIFIETIPKRGWRFIAPVGCERTGELAPELEEVAAVERTSEITSPSLEHGRRLGRWTILGVVAVVLLLVTAAIVMLRSKAAPATRASTEIRSIAVLPLTNISKDPGEQYFADGMTEELITRLASLENLRVISRTSVMQYRDSTKPLPQIASELKVDAIIEGAILRSGDRVRVTAQLVEAATDHHLWAESYERDASDVLDLQDVLARDIARQIAAKLSPAAEARLARPDPVNPEAYQAYLRGRYLWHARGHDELQKAIAEFQHAIAIDPNYAPAYAGLVDCYVVLPLIAGGNGAELYPKAKEAAAKALALDPTLGEVHNSVAYAKLYGDWDFAGAEKEFREAIRLSPNYSTAHQWYAELLALEGRHPEAVAEIQKALELDPLAGVVYHQAGQVYNQGREYDKAIAEYKKALALGFRESDFELARAYRRKGMYQEAAQAGAARYKAESSVVWQQLGLELEHSYERGGLPAYLRAITNIERQFSRPYYYLAVEFAVLHQDDKAFQYLERSYQERNIDIFFLNVDPEWDRLRSDPRMVALLEKIGLPQKV